MRILLALLIVCGFSAAASAQSLKAGDTIDISVFQDPKLDRRLVIDQSGQISFPLAGRLTASGLTPAGLESALKAKLKPNFKDALDVTVSLAAIARVERDRPDPIEDDLKPKVYITGEIARPGAVVVRKKTDIMQAIALAGGLGQYAAKRRIVVNRKVDGVETTWLFDYRAFESGEDLTRNIPLKSGDIIIVPERGLFE